MIPQVKPLIRHLTIDEPVTLTDRFGTEMTFRVRVWQGVDATPIVLASMAVNEDGHTYSPNCMTSKIANFVLGPMLGHPCCMMLYFEENIDPVGLPYLEQLYFEYFGNAHRLQMFQPERRVIEWERLEHSLEAKIER